MLHVSVKSGDDTVYSFGGTAEQRSVKKVLGRKKNKDSNVFTKTIKDSPFGRNLLINTIEIQIQEIQIEIQEHIFYQCTGLWHKIYRSFQWNMLYKIYPEREFDYVR